MTLASPTDAPSIWGRLPRLAGRGRTPDVGEAGGRDRVALGLEAAQTRSPVSPVAGRRAQLEKRNRLARHAKLQVAVSGPAPGREAVVELDQVEDGCDTPDCS